MNGSYHFGRFELDPATRQVLAEGHPITLGARAIDVLVALVERNDRVVTKDELLEMAWPGLIVEENNLQVQVSALRKALGASSIATVPGRGYRFALALSSAEKPALPAETPKHNLPQFLTSFIGREHDLREYARLLALSRLLTLTGIGGSGKTRLAIKLAESVLPSFVDGAWLVDLAPLSDAERVPLAVMAALGIRNRLDRPHAETICEHLAGRRALIVLDNCEHLASVCAELVRQVLAAAPGVQVLATSREALDVRGEQAVTVRSLDLPAIGTALDPARLSACESIRLFLERARLAAPRFSLDPQNAAAIAEICRRLDGIPLAIELAAARVKVLSVDEIRARLDDRFRMLTSARGGAAARQQTLLAAIQWSYDHLAEDEQKLLRTLSVFAGGWTLAAAVRVVGERADEYEILDVLTRLADRSLVTIEWVADGTTRYALLETVREYAKEQLDASGAGRVVRKQHLQYFLELAEEAALRISSDAPGPWLARLKAETENLLQALAWCGHVEDGAILGLRLATKLGPFWFHSGLIELGHRETSTALGRPGAQARNRIRTAALVEATHLASTVRSYPEADRYATEALSIAREIGDRGLVAEALRILGYIALERGDDAAALSAYTEALALAREIGDPLLIGKSVCGIGEVHRAVGDWKTAQACYEEALGLAREAKSTILVAAFSDNLARTLICRGELERARQLAQDVLTLSQSAGSQWTALCIFDITAGLAAVARDWPFAARMRGAAEAHIRNFRHVRDRVDEAFVAPWTQRIREALGEGAYCAAYDGGHALNAGEAAAEALGWMRKRPGEKT